MITGWLSLALLGALSLGASRVSAQSCCGVVSEDELSVVAPHRRAVFTGRVSAKHMLGRHDSEGHYRSLSANLAATDAVLSLGGGARMPFYERLQLHGTLTGRLQHRELPSFIGSGAETATRVGVGDASLFVRWSILYDDQRGLRGEGRSLAPWLDVFFGARAPLGRYDQGPRASDLARTMGDGAWGVIAGARAIKYLTPSNALRLSLRYDARLKRDANLALTGANAFSPGDQVGVTLGYLGLSGMWWMFGCTADVTFTLPSQSRAPGASFRTVPGTAMRETALGVHVTRVLLMPRLDLTASVVYTLPFDQLSKNLSWEGIQGGLAVRHHWFP